MNIHELIDDVSVDNIYFRWFFIKPFAETLNETSTASQYLDVWRLVHMYKAILLMVRK